MSTESLRPRLRRVHWIVAVVAAALIAILTSRLAQSAQGQETRSQDALATELLSSDKQARNIAFEKAQATDLPNASPALRSALITLLDRQSAEVARARRDGRTVDQYENPEFIAGVHHAVARLNDRQAIPAMARALGKFTLIRALEGFGEEAVPAVLGVVTSPVSHYPAVDDGLRILRLVVEGQTEESRLSTGTMNSIRGAATQRLSGEQYFTTYWYAIDLAAVLHDPMLDDTLQRIATLPSETMLRGITDARLVEQTQKRAKDRLAGVPAFPRPGPDDVPR